MSFAITRLRIKRKRKKPWSPTTWLMLVSALSAAAGTVIELTGLFDPNNDTTIKTLCGIQVVIGLFLTCTCWRLFQQYRKQDEDE